MNDGPCRVPSPVPAAIKKFWYACDTPESNMIVPIDGMVIRTARSRSSASGDSPPTVHEAAGSEVISAYRLERVSVSIGAPS